MSLLSSVRRNVAVFRKNTIASFALNDPGEEYARNGYYGIYRAAYGGGYSSALGGRVTEDRALSLTAFYAGIKIISEDVGSLPCFVYQHATDGATLAKDHPLYQKLHDAPNPDMTAIQFREALTAHALLCGAAYAHVERSRGDSSRIIAMWPLMPYEIRREQDSRRRPIFIHTPGGGPQKTYSQREIFQLNGFGLTGYDGLNILQYARNTIGLGLAQEEYASRFFSQDQTPNIVLKHPLALGPEGVAGVKQAWSESSTGSGNPADKWHAPKVLQEGMDIVQLHPDNQKSQLTEQRAFQLLEVCRLLRMPPHKLAEMGRATWNNISAQNTQYYNETLRPWLLRWEQASNLWLLGLDSGYYVEHEIAGMLRGDFAMQTEGFRSLLAAGVYSVNEVRGYLNLNPVDGGDERFVQLNQGTIQNVAQGVVNDQPADDADKVVPIQPRAARAGGVR